MGRHLWKDCPRAHKDKDKEKGKEKAVHMMQLLPLETSTKYLAVQVSHQIEVHECCLMAAPWQPTLGPHELFQLHGMINGQ